MTSQGNDPPGLKQLDEGWTDKRFRRLMTACDATRITGGNPMNLANQVALVTGAGQGIGKASALALAEAGAHVVVADIARQHADATTEAMMSRQRRALAVQADVGDLRDIDRMIRETLNTFGQIDIRVNNAGVTRRADIMDLTEEDWD